MRRWLPDWLIYLMAFLVLVFVLYRMTDRADVPPAFVDGDQGALLQPPSIYDQETLVQVGPVQSGVGTAFAIDSSGLWLTARHVVEACDEVGLVVATGFALKVTQRPAAFTDLALLQTDGAPTPLALDRTEDDFRLGQVGYHIGYPTGRPGEVASRLMGRERLLVRGRFAAEMPVIAYAERGRTGGLNGSLAGMSGGPVLDEAGNVIGVTIAESARRGRIYTVGPKTINEFLRVENIEQADGAPAGTITEEGYGRVADELRRTHAIAQVVCMSGNR